MKQFFLSKEFWRKIKISKNENLEMKHENQKIKIQIKNPAIRKQGNNQTILPIRRIKEKRNDGITEIKRKENPQKLLYY